MIDLLVVSHACFMAINRKVYQLFLKDGWNIEIVAPLELQFPTGRKAANPPEESDPQIHFLPLRGQNPRTYAFEGLNQLLHESKPRLVLLDNDPVSRMAVQIGKWCGQNNANLYCISCENLPLGTIDAVKRSGIANLPSIIVKRLMLSQSRHLVNGVFCINGDGKKIFESEGYKAVYHIPLGFDPEIFYPDHESGEKIRKNLGVHGTLFAYFGRIIPEKGIHVLINALSELKQFDWQLMMDHFAEYESEYHNTVRNLINEAGIDDRVIHVHPNHVEIAGFMNAADVIVVPSVSTKVWKEQYGRVAAEAMACGKTVIASDSGALPELLNGHGIIFPEGDYHTLAVLLEKYLTRVRTMAQEKDPSVFALAELSINRQQQIMESAFLAGKKLSA